MNWIKVAERLPSAGERVLFAIAGGFVAEGYIDKKNKWYRINSYAVKPILGDVVAWMPIPVYKEGEYLDSDRQRNNQH